MQPRHEARLPTGNSHLTSIRKALVRYQLISEQPSCQQADAYTMSCQVANTLWR